MIRRSTHILDLIIIRLLPGSFAALFLILSAAPVLQAQTIPVSIKTSVDTTMATIGDQIHLDVGLRYPEGTRFVFPALEKNLGKFEIVGAGFTREKGIAGGFEKRWQLTLAIFDTGKVNIPPLEIKAVVPPDTVSVLTFTTDGYTIDVISVLPPGTSEPKDIKAPFPIRKVVPWDYIIFFLVLAAIAGSGIFYYRRWKIRHPSIEFDEKFLEAPHVIAFLKLEQLKNAKWETPEERQQYYFALSMILREYLEHRYFVRAVEMSTYEIGLALTETDMEAAFIREFDQVLQEMDLVKFAKQIPAESSLPIIWQRAWRCVEQTRKEQLLSRSDV